MVEQPAVKFVVVMGSVGLPCIIMFALAGTHASCPSRLRSKTTARLAHCQTDVRWTPGSFSDSEDRGEWRRKGDVSLKLRSMGDFVYDTLHTFTSTTINH